MYIIFLLPLFYLYILVKKLNLQSLTTQLKVSGRRQLMFHLFRRKLIEYIVYIHNVYIIKQSKINKNAKKDEKI